MTNEEVRDTLHKCLWAMRHHKESLKNELYEKLMQANEEENFFDRLEITTYEDGINAGGNSFGKNRRSIPNNKALVL